MRSSLQGYVRHFPINKGKQHLISLLWKPLANNNQTRLQTRLVQADIQLACDLNQFIQRQIFFYGAYEQEACDFWIKYARNAEVIFDVGSNIGIYSLLAAATSPGARIIAFEPTPEVFEMFQQNVLGNKLKNVIANRSAVGRQNGFGILNKCAGVDGRNEGMNFVSSVSGLEPRSEQLIPVISLDSYCQENGIQNIDLMKMDIEGGEYDALLGATELLERRAIKVIFVELAEWSANRSGHSTYDIKRLLSSAGYRLFSIRNGKLVALEVEGTNNISTAIAVADDGRAID